MFVAWMNCFHAGMTKLAGRIPPRATEAFWGGSASGTDWIRAPSGTVSTWEGFAPKRTCAAGTVRGTDLLATMTGTGVDGDDEPDRDLRRRQRLRDCLRLHRDRNRDSLDGGRVRARGDLHHRDGLRRRAARDRDRDRNLEAEARRLRRPLGDLDHDRRWRE